MSADDPDQPAAPSFFDTLLTETLDPLSLAVGDLELVVEVPDGDQVSDLDAAVTPSDVLEVLLAPLDDDGEQHPDDEAALDELFDELDEQPAGVLLDLVDQVRAHFALTVSPPEGWDALVDMLDRFGAGIEWDLITLPNAPRLHDFLRDPRRHPWGLLYRLLPYLPQGGGYWAAVQADEELAEAQVDAEKRGHKPKNSKHPPLLGWTPQAERETAILDLLRQEVHATWGASSKFKGKGGTPPKPLPRPRSAQSWVRRRLLLEEHDEIVDMLLPRGTEPPPDEAYVSDGYREDAPRGSRAIGGSERLPSRDAVRGAVMLDP